MRHVSAVDYPPVARAPPIDEYYPRRQIAYEPDYVHPVPRERVRPSYRELPSHRIPDYYDDKYAAADEHSVREKSITLHSIKSKRLVTELISIWAIFIKLIKILFVLKK